jgi:hypothetical protein
VNGTEIIGPDGRQFVPYGVTIYGLSGATPDWQSQVPEELARISAIASFWHGNTVRIQISPTYLTQNTPGFLNAVEQLVSAAEQKGLNAILSAQYEYTTKLAMPDTETLAFWETLATTYAHDPRVWFDLFNEPQLSVKEAGGSKAQLWRIWRDGGTATVKGQSTSYLGMQQLVDSIRQIDSSNILLAEGIDGGKSLDQVATYRLNGSNIVYAIHSYLNPGFDTPAEWQRDWGQVAQTLPVVDDEFGEQQGTQASCRPDAPTLVPELLAFLAARHIGLIGHALVPGEMIRGNNLTDPTSFDPGVPYQCGQHSNGPGAQGAGADLLQYFASQAATPKS